MKRRTKMAMAHRKCDECHFWFQSAKTYHQHRSQLPNQLSGENKVKNSQLTTEFFFKHSESTTFFSAELKHGRNMVPQKAFDSEFKAKFSYKYFVSHC